MNSEKRATYNDWLIGGILMLILILTRSGHFGSSFKLPDTSWAMFWLSGALSLRWWWPALMMVAAALIDYFVISNGVSSYCVTPAYPFLIPAYLSLCVTGRWAAHSLNGDARSLLRVAVSILNGVTLAFIISNVGFYLFAGYFSKMTAWQYFKAVSQYWSGYLAHASLYIATALLIRSIVSALRGARTETQTSGMS